MKIQADISDENNYQLKIYKAKEKLDSLQEALDDVLTKFFKEKHETKN